MVALSNATFVPVITLPVKVEFAILVMVALSPVALSKLISVDKWSMSELSTFNFVMVALSKVVDFPLTECLQCLL